MDGSFGATLSWWQPKAPLLAKQYAPSSQTLVNVALVEEHGAAVLYVEHCVF